MSNVPNQLADVADYERTGDCSNRYFRGSYLEYTDSRGRVRIAKIHESDDESKQFSYQAVTLDGLNLSRNTYRKAWKEFRVLHQLPPTVFISSGIPHWGGGHGVHTNAKSASASQMLCTRDGVHQSSMEVMQLTAYLGALANPIETFSGDIDEVVAKVSSGDVAGYALSSELFITPQPRGSGFVAVFQGIRLRSVNKRKLLELL